MAQNVNLVELAGAHTMFATSAELGSDAATDAPATTPFCAGVAIGATLTMGC